MMRKDLSWNSLLYDYSDRLLKFVVNAQTNTLPTPDNLRRWNLKKNAVCGLCGQTEVTLSHVLAGCKWVRETENKLDREDRFTWRHNNVLYLLASVIKEYLNHIKKLPEKKAGAPLITFVPAGVTKKPSSSKLFGIFSQARDWVLDFDLPEFRLPFSKYVFPANICATPLKIDGHVISKMKRICVGIELTVPMEENIAAWHQSKLKKELRLEAERNKWSFYSVVLEVGARWVPPSVTSSLNFLGLPAIRYLQASFSDCC